MRSRRAGRAIGPGRAWAWTRWERPGAEVAGRHGHGSRALQTRRASLAAPAAPTGDRTAASAWNAALASIEPPRCDVVHRESCCPPPALAHWRRRATQGVPGSHAILTTIAIVLGGLVVAAFVGGAILRGCVRW